MPNKPALIKIYDEIEERAGNIAKSKGYFTTVGKIKRSPIEAPQGGDFPAFSFWPETEAQDPGDYDGEDHTLFLILGYFTNISEDQPYMDIAAELAADVVVAMNRKTTSPASGDVADPDLGGLVTSFTVTGTQPIIYETQSPYCGCLIQVSIKYNTPTGDPFNITDDSESVK